MTLNKLHSLLPKIPWFFIIGVIGICLGLGFKFSDIKVLPTLQDNYEINIKLEDFLTFQPLLLVEGLTQLMNPSLIISTLGMELIILVEGVLTIEVSESICNKKVNIFMEYLGLSVINGATAVMGILPVGFPITRVIVALESGASLRVFHIFNMIFISLIFLFFFPLLAYIPTCILKAINFATAFLLMDFGRLLSFRNISWMYQIIAITIPIMNCITDITTNIFLSLIISMAYYIVSIKMFKVTNGDIEISTQIIEENDDKGKIQIFILKGFFNFDRKDHILALVDSDTDKVVLDFTNIW